MNNFEQALNKLDRLEQNLNSQAEEITQKDHLITEKDNRNAQLHKLFQGTAKIFSKQHNYVDNLKTKLEKEKQEKGISQEQAKHLQEDISRLDTEKNELDKRVKELENLDEESRKLRDTELNDLRTKLATSAQSLADIQTVDQQVYDVLEQESQQTGLLLRSQEVIQKIKDLRAGRDKFIKDMERVIDGEGEVVTLAEDEFTDEEMMIMRIECVMSTLNDYKQQLNKELSWWDKWIDDGDDGVFYNSGRGGSKFFIKSFDSVISDPEMFQINLNISSSVFHVVNYYKVNPDIKKNAKLSLKRVSKYYRDK